MLKEQKSDYREFKEYFDFIGQMLNEGLTVSEAQEAYYNYVLTNNKD